MICTLREFLASIEPEHSYRLFRYTDEAFKRRKCYSRIVLKKKSGGIRILQAPEPKLKRLQRKLLPYLSHASISPCAAAYVEGRTLLDHARYHAGAKIVVKLDIEDFFDSITFPKVFHAVDEALKRSPLVEPTGEISWFIAEACTLDHRLPQGAPTSPMLSNMIFFPLDCIISSYCSERRIRYTRYSDDMIFSGDFQPSGLIRFIRKLLRKNGFILNEDKIVIAGQGRQQKITGVVVNRRPQAERKYRREIRQDLYYIGKYGLEDHLERKGIFQSGNEEVDRSATIVKELQSLIGKIVFVLQIDPGNEEFKEYKELSVSLLNQIPLIWNGSQRIERL